MTEKIQEKKAEKKAGWKHISIDYTAHLARKMVENGT
jgi:hypothetical protein